MQGLSLLKKLCGGQTLDDMHVIENITHCLHFDGITKFTQMWYGFL